MAQRDMTTMAIVAAVGVGAYFLLRKNGQIGPLISRAPVYGTGTGIVTVQPTPVAPPRVAEEKGFIQNILDFFTAEPVAYKSPAQWRAELRPLFRQQESSFAMPSGLLEAVAERESAFRHDIITGETLGSSGEEGIMQLKPQYHLSSFAERTNPKISIPYAARYLAKNFMRFGTWPEAVAAYNCGPTRLAQGGIDACPGITKEYVAQVTSTIGIRG